MPYQKTLRDRVIHALGFECLALLICAPTIALVMDKPLFSAGAMTLAISLTATVWNMLYNTLFDRLQGLIGFQKTFFVRVLHTLGFEGGLIVAVVPLAAWWLSMSLLEAFVMEIGLLAFLLPYTYVYNLAFDKWLERNARQAQTVL